MEVEVICIDCRWTETKFTQPITRDAINKVNQSELETTGAKRWKN